MSRRLALAFLAVALAAGAAGCGSSGGGDPLAPDSTTAIIAEAMTNTVAARSVTISGGASATQSVDLTFVRGVGCTGTITQGATTSTLIWIGKAVYAHSAGAPANQWMRGTSSDPSLQGLLALCVPSSILAPLSPSAFSGATRSATVVGGQPALALTPPGSGTSGPGTVIVSDTATPVVLAITSPGHGSLTFSGYGAAKTITPPSAS
jgi:hypothetical protein